jgi:peptidoglycan/LPS O-acetylase OafA/YrhL
LAGHISTRPDEGASAALSLFRFSLALMVMATHLTQLTPIQTGRVAVEAFFCISGFLITMVANGRYAGRPFAFLSNRFLRIYPTYWTCAAVGFAVVALYPTARAIHPSLILPVSAHDWFANLFVFGLTQETISRVLPAAWSLHTELWFYLVIGLVTATKPRMSLAMLGISLAVSAWSAFRYAPFQFYGTPIGNADAFFIGSVLWQFRAQLKPARPLLVAAIGFAVFEFLAWGPLIGGSHTVNEFLGAPAAAVLLLGLWTSHADGAIARLRGACSVLGRLSYPVFLLHWPLGAMVNSVTGIGQGWLLWSITAVITIALSGAILLFVEDPIAKLRASIRRASPSMPPVTASAIMD